VVRRTRGTEVKTITLMSKAYNGDYIFSKPRRAINGEKVWIYSVLSADGGATPLHYWTSMHSVMEDFWTQDELDQYADFHGASAVVRLELDADAADALIAEIRGNAIDHSPTKSMLDDA
jgi:hypothetical protein